MANKDNKKSSVLYEDWARLILSFEDGAAVQLSRAIAAFTVGEEYEITDPTVKALFETVILPVLSNNRETYEKKKTENAERKRKWRESHTSVTPTSQDVTPCHSPETAYMEDDRCKDGKMEDVKMVDEYPTDTKEKKSPDTTYQSSKKRAKAEPALQIYERIGPEFALGSVLDSAVRDWLTYKKERHETYGETGLRSLIRKIVQMANDHGDDAVVNIINDSMSSNYKGILWDKIGQPQHGKTYIDAIEHRLDGISAWVQKGES